MKEVMGRRGRRREGMGEGRGMERQRKRRVRRNEEGRREVVRGMGRRRKGRKGMGKGWKGTFQPGPDSLSPPYLKTTNLGVLVPLLINWCTDRLLASLL